MSFKIDSLLKDKIVLYIVLFFAVTNFFGYIMMDNYDSIVTMMLAGLFASYFSKNMIVILLSAIIGGSLVVGASTINEGVKHHVREGMETQKKKEEFASLGSISGKKGDKKDDNTVKVDKTALEAQNEELNALSATPEGKAYLAGVSAGQKQEKNEKKEKFSTQNDDDKKKQYKPASSEMDSKMAGLNETEAAMARLDKLLGSEGIDKLVKNQQGLNETMKSIEPLMNKAESMISSLTNTGLLERLDATINRIGSK